MTLRLLDLNDSVEELTELIHRAYRPLGEAGFNLTGADQSVEVTRQRIAEAECWVAFDKRLIGTILVRHPDEAGDCDYFRRPGVSVINQFAVEQTCQGTGVGSELIERAELRAGEWGACEIALDTPEAASVLVEWYGKRGYLPVDSVQWPGKTYRSAILAKSLL